MQTDGKNKVVNIGIVSAAHGSHVAGITAGNGFLATPGQGVGIFDREGVAAGSSYKRTYTLTRTSGSGGPVTYKVSWAGDVGTFSSPATITLPLSVAVPLQVSVNVASAGEHTAIMNLDEPSSAGIEFQALTPSSRPSCRAQPTTSRWPPPRRPERQLGLPFRRELPTHPRQRLCHLGAGMARNGASA